MAGLGFKDFQVGEVLTSSDVDGYLMQQTVMRFADAGARGSALGTASGTGVALAEGMVSYLDDANRVEHYTGSVWLPVAYVLNVQNAYVSTDQTFTQASYADLTDATITVNPGSVDSRFLIIFTAWCDPSASTQFRIKLQANGSDVGEQGEIVPDTGRDQMPALMRLHSPASTAAQTYKIQVQVTNAGGSMTVRNSSLTVMELRV